ncbi:PP2C family protein-serine/threonine phosphatase [Streptomyces sp. NPDC102381]|uniref:PP2C family protein-serine/threonine phosphatase n=1 Tax=Streptomyces sp. NPDC102381 TaxID=3366164 RepID=UPI003802A19E
MRNRLAAPQETWLRLLPGPLVALLTALDLAYHEHWQGIIVTLTAVPAMSLIMPGGRSPRQPLVAGSLALAGAVLGGAVDWHGRPVVVVATWVNIALLTAIGHYLRRRCQAPAPVPATPSTALRGSTAPPPVVQKPDAPTTQTHRLGDFRVALRSLPQPDRTTMAADVCDVRETPFGIRVLVADLMGKDESTRSAGAELLERWRHLANTEPSLAEIARRLDSALAELTDRFAKTLLLALREGRGELVCCGHPLPLVLSDHEDVRALDILAPLPPLGLFGLVPHGITVYTTSFTVGPRQRLLIHTDGIDAVRDAAGTPFPLLERIRSHASQGATALLDALVADLAEHSGAHTDGIRDEALLLLLQAEKREFQHLTTTLHMPRPGSPARPDGDRVGA